MLFKLVWFCVPVTCHGCNKVCWQIASPFGILRLSYSLQETAMLFWSFLEWYSHVDRGNLIPQMTLKFVQAFLGSSAYRMTIMNLYLHSNAFLLKSDFSLKLMICLKDCWKTSHYVLQRKLSTWHRCFDYPNIQLTKIVQFRDPRSSNILWYIVQCSAGGRSFQHDSAAWGMDMPEIKVDEMQRFLIVRCKVEVNMCVRLNRLTF